MVKKLTVFIICLLVVTASFWMSGCELLGLEDTEDTTKEVNLNNYDNQNFDTSTPKGTVNGFLHVLPSGDLYEWDEYLASEASSSGTSSGINEFAAEFAVASPTNISIEISNIILEELWSTGSKVAIRTTYVLNTRANGKETSSPEDYTFLLDKSGEEWLITGWSYVPLPPPPPPKTAIPIPSPEPVVTGTPVSTGTATPVKVGDIIFYDDFTHKSDVWPIYSNGHGIAYYKDGTLHINHRGILQNPEVCVARQSFDNFVLQLDTALVDGDEDSWIIVVCRSDYLGNGYRFLISADGRYAIDAHSKKGGSKFLQESAFSEHLKAGYDVPNQLRIEFVDDIMRFYVNGHLLSEMRDGTFESGMLGLGVSNIPGNGSAEAMFDNVMVNAISVEIIP